MLATAVPQVRAAEYVRMSTDRQQNSVEFQSAAIRRYAKEHGFEVVRTFVDAGRSGITIDKRDALQELLRTVVNGEPGFEALIVYDVSRFGRFQDIDEAAHYEFLCRSNGVPVHYCAEPFSNDPTPFDAVVKSLRRAMAGEYSRDLSLKISAVRRQLANKGYFPGGAAGYGLRRLAVSAEGEPKVVLEHGERKPLPTDRVRYTLGPPQEVAVVRRIYSLFLDEHQNFAQIADLLNIEGQNTDLGRDWSPRHIQRILTHEKYIGTVITNRFARGELGGQWRRLPPSQWVRVEAAFEPIIELHRFIHVQRILRNYPYNEEYLLGRLKTLLRREGKLSARIIRRAGPPNPEAYSRFFGSLLEAYHRVGYHPSEHVSGAVARRYARCMDANENLLGPSLKRRYSAKILQRREAAARRVVQRHLQTDEQLLDLLRGLWRAEGRLSGRLIAASKGLPSVKVYIERFGGLTQAYDRIGYEPPRWVKAMLATRLGRELHGEQGVIRPTAERIELLGGWQLSDAEMLEALEDLLKREGFLSTALINRAGFASVKQYRARFGSLFSAYKLVGFEPDEAQFKGAARLFLERERARLGEMRMNADQVGG